MERALVQRYRRDIEAVLPRLSAANLEDAVALATIAEGIRGYGPVKAANLARIEPEWSALEVKFGLGETA
jgi:indolepyruvate ferredoxin oxidoreductase